jgi:dolichol-phosphate mannosyltransferase
MRAEAPSPEISIVVPLYNEQENLPELFRRLVRSLDDARLAFELIFVNDGSRDATANLLDEIHAADARVTVIALSRNFGHQAAVSAGIDHARGRAVILMDGDLQDPPEVLPQFIDAWRQGNDVVYAVRTKRKEGLFKRICYAVFYRILHRVSDLDIPLDSGDFCLMDRKVIDALKSLPERNRFVRGLRTFVGFKQVGLAYERAARMAGQPKYTFKALVKLAMDGIINFSSAPLNLVTWTGVLLLAGALVGAGTSIAGTVLGHAIAGWWIASLTVVGCTGLQLLGTGILGEYIRRIFVETKGRPTYVIGSIKPCRASLGLSKVHAKAA